MIQIWSTFVAHISTSTQYLSVRLPGGGMWQAGGGMSRTGRWGRRQRGGGDGGSHVSPPDAVPSSQRGGWKRWGIEGHAADPALNLFGPQLCALLFLLNQPERRGGKIFFFILSERPLCPFWMETKILAAQMAQISLIKGKTVITLT